MGKEIGVGTAKVGKGVVGVARVFTRYEKQNEPIGKEVCEIHHDFENHHHR